MASKKTNRVAGVIAGMLNTVSYVLLIVGISLAIATFAILVANDVLALVKESQEIPVELKADTSVEEIAVLLEEKGAIEYPWVFELYTKLKHVETFEAGSYTIDKSMDYGQMISSIQKSGIQRAVVRVTIPEGYNLKEICALLVENDVVKEEAFWEVANGYDFAHAMLQDVPMEENRLEGYLFPDTYDFYTNSEKVPAYDHAVDVINAQGADFKLLQEIDISATRSYHVDEAQLIQDALDGFVTFAQNYDSPYLFYPIAKPHGASKSGLLTLSEAWIERLARISLPIETGFMKFLDLDRCYSKSWIPVANG